VPILIAFYARSNCGSASLHGIKSTKWQDYRYTCVSRLWIRTLIMIKYMYCICKRADLSEEEFHTYWEKPCDIYSRSCKTLGRESISRATRWIHGSTMNSSDRAGSTPPPYDGVTEFSGQYGRLPCQFFKRLKVLKRRNNTLLMSPTSLTFLGLVPFSWGIRRLW